MIWCNVGNTIWVYSFDGEKVATIHKIEHRQGFDTHMYVIKDAYGVPIEGYPRLEDAKQYVEINFNY